MCRIHFISILNYLKNRKNYIFGNLRAGDKICYISSIYIYTSGLWAYYLITSNILIDSKTLDTPLSLMLSSNLYNHFGPYLMPKLLNQESLNKLMSMPNDSNLIAMGNSIRAFNRIAVNRCAIDYAMTIIGDKNVVNDGVLHTNKLDIMDSYGNIWNFNKFLYLLCDPKLKLYNNVTNHSKFVNLLNSIESLMLNLPIEHWEVPYQYLKDLSMAAAEIEEEWIRERILFILSQFMRNQNNVRKLVIVEMKGIDLLFDVLNNGLTYKSDFNIFDYTQNILNEYPILKLLYTEFDEIIKLVNSTISDELNGQLPLMDNKCLLNYHFRRFIDNNKLPIQFTLFYTSLKDFLVPLRTVGFQQTFLKGMIKSLKAVNCLIACKLIFCSENIVINSYKYYNSNLFMVPISIGMAIFNVTILTKLLKYSKNFLLPFVLSETIM